MFKKLFPLEKLKILQRNNYASLTKREIEKGEGYSEGVSVKKEREFLY